MRAPDRIVLALLAGLGAAAPAAALAPPAPCPPVAMAPLPAPSFAAAVAARRAPVIVAFGSSSTAGAGATEALRSYPAVLERRLRYALGLPVTVLNRGIGGEAAEEMAARLDRDVLAAQPDLVIWQVGGNSALRSADPERYRALVREGLERLTQAGISVVLMDNQRAPRIAARPNHRTYDAITAELARAVPGVALFSRGALMDAWARAGVPGGAVLTGDDLHHNDRGYACLAEALAAALLDGLTPVHSRASNVPIQ
ncbi:lysophospholipase L1-like esterase [Roseomonas alkaliterrae]|uniref:Lysophospholipase L1-like esterase n=2 Tax=Neoroseomonas alkaliterrae TaxID=1452450 RepID=A0A840XLT0_9PROT|nr:GDSL-type esterase/lipase family protein [Neoroseomonas alkaliterrae]MBB5688876.1 lysophospholipase L1-like esterase [Neoroseomonas alkaliterrae]